MRSLKFQILLGSMICFSSHAGAGSIGWYKIPDEAVSGSIENGRVLVISQSEFDKITSKARVGDRIDVDGEVYEAVVVVPRHVLTVVDKSTRTEMRVLVKPQAPPRKK